MQAFETWRNMARGHALTKALTPLGFTKSTDHLVLDVTQLQPVVKIVTRNPSLPHSLSDLSDTLGCICDFHAESSKKGSAYLVALKFDQIASLDQYLTSQKV